MKHIQQAGEHLDECTACGGVWFDEGELRAFAHAKVHGTLREGALRHYFRGFPGDPAQCPACKSPALRDGMSENHALRGCDGCGGFFLPPETLESLETLSSVRRKRSFFATTDSVDLGYLGEAVMDLLQSLRS
jgi:Zn-finger nucleic acid-binding protein